jgi:hypothetical protein
MITTNNNGLRRIAAGIQIGTPKQLATLGGVVALFATIVDARAVLINQGNFNMVQSPDAAAAPQAGTVVGHLVSNFGPSSGGSTTFFGTLESYVVKRTAASVINGTGFNAGGLDFWVQLSLDTVQSVPAADLSRMTYSPFASLVGGPIDAEFLNVVGLVNGAVPTFSGVESAGTQIPYTVQDSAGNVVAWDWTLLNQPDHSMTFANPMSKWLVLHTNDTQFGQVDAAILDGGQSTARTFAPVPEPAAGLFGLAITGVLGLVRNRNKRCAQGIAA